MMQADSVMHSMTPLMGQMNDVMRDTQDTMNGMKGQVTQEHMAKMSQIMGDMSKELSDMSRAMDRGKVSDKQLQTMQDRMTQMRSNLDTLQKRQ